jgi:hypothetical protein
MKDVRIVAAISLANSTPEFDGTETTLSTRTWSVSPEDGSVNPPTKIPPQSPERLEAISPTNASYVADIPAQCVTRMVT